MIIRHGLLKISNYPTNNKQSSIILNNEIIITSATILKSHLIKKGSLLFQNTQIDLILDSLTNANNNNKKLIKVQEDKEFEFLKLLKFETIFDQRSNFDENSNSQRILTRYQANLLYLYNCEKIRNIFKIIFEKLNPSIHNDDNHITEVLRSSFIILNLNKEILSSTKINDFIQSVIEYDKFSRPINKLDDVLTICTPFGIENFYKTINIGKISNILDKNCSLFIISNTLPQGCEGSAVLNNKLRLIGILICTSLKTDNEHFSFSLVGNFSYILKEFINQYGIQFSSPYLRLTRQPANWENSLVIINTTNNQGTGTFVKILNRKFIITCSHVLSKDDLISCRYIDGSFSSNIIWKNPNYNEPYDIALLSVPSNITDNHFVNLSNRKPRLAEIIYNAGFPFFTNLNDRNLSSTFEPSIFEGRIIKYSPGVLISDGKLQSGQSGGPMFDENGSIMGICVSNLKLDNTIYPNMNTSVPVCDIKHILEKYVKSNDDKVLNNLISSLDVKKRWALERPFIESKL